MCIRDSKYTDRVLLDIKYTDDTLYRENVGCSLISVLDFLSYLNERGIPTTLRQVIIPTINDNEDNIKKLNAIASAHPCVDKIELLPFRKICTTKYEALNIEFPFLDIPEATSAIIDDLKQYIPDYV